MNEKSETEIIKAWIIVHKVEYKSSTYEANFWAVEYLMRLAHDDPEKLFNLIPKILLNDNSEKIILHVGAGPLQDIVNLYSDEYIEKISILARTLIDFRAALKNVIVDDDCNHELGRLINSFK